MKINEALRNKEIKIPSQERLELIKKKGFSVDSTTKILEEIYGQDVNKKQYKGND
ncbi:hypothetical protein D3C73_1641450 [compost metagenome]